jgi:hypothetical protein
MELFNLWLPLIGGGIFIAVAIGAWFAEHKLTGIWFGFSGAVCFLLLAALQLQEHELSSRDTNHPDAIAQKQLRAYIYLDKAIVVLDGRTLKGEVEMRNSGQTPAYDLTVKIRMQTMEAANPFEFQPPSVAVPAVGIVGPGTKFYVGTEVTIPEANQIAIPGFIDGRGIIYLIGQAQYRDAFNKIWVLDFRMRSKVFEGDHWAMQPAEDGNKETKKE